MNRRRWMRCGKWRALAAAWTLAAVGFAYFLVFGVTIAPMGPVAQYLYSMPVGQPIVMSRPLNPLPGAQIIPFFPPGMGYRPTPPPNTFPARIQHHLAWLQFQFWALAHPSGEWKNIESVGFLRFYAPWSIPGQTRSAGQTFYTTNIPDIGKRAGVLTGSALTESLSRASRSGGDLTSQVQFFSLRRWLTQIPKDIEFHPRHSSLDEYGIELVLIRPDSDGSATARMFQSRLCHYRRIRFYLDWRNGRMALGSVPNKPDATEDHGAISDALIDFFIERDGDGDASAPDREAGP